MRIISISSVRVSPNHVHYEIMFDEYISSTPAVYLSISYENGENEVHSAEEKLQNVATISSVDIGGTVLRGDAFITDSDGVEDILSFTASTSITINNVRIDADDGSGGIQSQSFDLEDTVQGAPYSPVGSAGSLGHDQPPQAVNTLREGSNDAEFVAAIGNAYVFDGLVFKNLTSYPYSSENGREGDEEIVSKHFELSQPCNIISVPDEENGGGGNGSDSGYGRAIIDLEEYTKNWEYRVPDPNLNYSPVSNFYALRGHASSDIADELEAIGYASGAFNSSQQYRQGKLIGDILVEERQIEISQEELDEIPEVEIDPIGDYGDPEEPIGEEGENGEGELPMISYLITEGDELPYFYIEVEQ